MAKAITDGKMLLPSFSVEEKHIDALEVHGLCCLSDIVVPKNSKFWILKIGKPYYVVYKERGYQVRLVSMQKGSRFGMRDLILAPALTIEIF